jgi:hypothetical protein
MHMTRLDIRRIGATGALLMAAIYYLIGLGVLSVGGSTTSEPIDMFAFGIGAGTAFLVIAVLFLLTDQRWIWFLALLFEVLVFVIYVAVSGSRVPQFEIWGLTLRAIQLAVIAVLVYLTVHAPESRSTEVQS